jgi:hypothetical protein
VALARAAWKARQGLLDPTRLVFIDETGTSTNMARLRGRCRRGQRLIGKVPHGHWKITTFVAALRHDAITAPFVIDEPMKGRRQPHRSLVRANQPNKPVSSPPSNQDGRILNQKKRLVNPQTIHINLKRL